MHEYFRIILHLIFFFYFSYPSRSPPSTDPCTMMVYFLIQWLIILCFSILKIIHLLYANYLKFRLYRPSRAKIQSQDLYTLELSNLQR